MRLLFSDALETLDTSGLYTLMGFVDGVWIDLHSVSGVPGGTIEVDASVNTIPVDTSKLIPGQSYDFKWVDGNGIDSNVIHLTIPDIAIRDYAAGVSTIDFTNTGGDNYTIGFHATPISFQSLSGATVVGFQYKIIHGIAGHNTDIDSGTSTSDYSKSVSSYGAGVYKITCTYKLSNGLGFEIEKFVKVDSEGAILISLNFDGIIINSVSGLTMNVTCDFTQVNSTLPTMWANYNGSNISILGTGSSMELSVPTDTIIVLGLLPLDNRFSDFGGDIAAAFAQLSIY